MSIASELSALNGYILGAYDEINTKGGTVPSNKNMANLASAIASISSGGGIDLSGFLGLTKAVTGSFRPSGIYYTDVTHNLGVLPKLAIYVLTDPTDLSNATSSSSQCSILGIKIQTGQFLEGTNRMESGIFVEAGVIGYNPSTYVNTSAYGTFRSQSVPMGSDGAYQTSLYATSLKSGASTRPLNAYKATETSITFYRGNNNAYLKTSATYNYLVAG